MNTKFPGLLIRLERLKRGWSQESLCHGICAVSYLSKIEQGKAEVSGEIPMLLLKRLGIRWKPGDKSSSQLVEDLYDAFFSLDNARASVLLKRFQSNRQKFLSGPNMLDFLLLEQAISPDEKPESAFLCEFVPAMDRRQYGLWLYRNGKFEELLKGWPCAFYFIKAGFADYRSGQYSLALEHLQRGYELAAEDGAVFAMLEARIFLGNCYSDLVQFGQMRRHYEAALRIARAVGDSNAIRNIRYNIASTCLVLGQTKEAYRYFHRLKDPSALDCHKLALCCESLGKREEAFSALQKAAETPCGFPSREQVLMMCAPVRFRLEHPDYLKHAEYGDMLLNCFFRLRAELPRGFALFHRSRVEEWYRANRQYKELCALLNDFPSSTG